MTNRHLIAVLASGSGTNLQAVLDAAEDAAYPAAVAVVISDRPQVRALERAEAAGVPAIVVDWSDYDSREAFTRAVCDAAEEHDAEALISSGFLRILSAEAPERFPDRIINTHPSLLPAFAGTIHAAQRAIDHGAKVSGVTVHYVVEEVDAGPIIAQEVVPVLPDDTAATLQQRIQSVEHKLYPQVIAALVRGDLTIDGRMVHWRRT